MIDYLLVDALAEHAALSLGVNHRSKIWVEQDIADKGNGKPVAAVIAEIEDIIGIQRAVQGVTDHMTCKARDLAPCRIVKRSALRLGNELLRFFLAELLQKISGNGETCGLGDNARGIVIVEFGSPRKGGRHLLIVEPSARAESAEQRRNKQQNG